MRKLCPKRILLSLYNSLIYTHLSYGICVWGTVEDTYLEKIRLSQNKALRAITGSQLTASTDSLYESVNVLKLDEIFQFQYASLMYDQNHGNLPSCFNTYFRKVEDIHCHNTRMASSHKLSENVKFKTKTHGNSMFKFKGPKILNKLNDLNFYGASKNKSYFRRKYKIKVFIHSLSKLFWIFIII